MECRQENGELCALVQSLRQEVADLKLAAARPHRHNTGNATVEVKLSVSISRLAKYAQLFVTPCFTADAFGVARPPFRHDHPDHYLESNLSSAYTADLYHVLPYKYHELIETSETLKTLVSTRLSYMNIY